MGRANGQRVTGKPEAICLSWCLRPDAPGIAICAAYLSQISQIDWMLECGQCSRGQAGRAFGLGHEGVALVAILADDSAVGADVLAVMAAEATVVVVVPEVVGMRLPVQLHFGEGGTFEDLLNLGDRIANL